MPKKVFNLFAVFILCLSVSVPCNAETYENLTELGLQSKSQILMEAETGNIIYEKNSHERLAPASVTKVMTLLLIYDAIDDGRIKWEDTVTVSEHAASMGGSQVFLEPYEEQTVRDMTKCIAVASANDASVAMAEHISGSEDAFVEAMNNKAKELGMEDTTFVNACGLDAENHLTSAYDIALMSRELITKHPEVFEFTGIWQDTIIHKTKRGETEFGLTNTNKLLKWYDGATGLKTGSTSKALYCLSGTASKNGMGLIGVVMAAPDFKIRFHEVMKLFDYGFANYSIEKHKASDSYISDVRINKGMVETAEAVVKDDIYILKQKGKEAEISEDIKIVPNINAPVEKGAKVGEVTYRINDEIVGQSDIIIHEAIPKANIASMYRRLILKWS
ncbi:MAG: D-alanyl-D-alanine carboxypeptidase family protein [Lachnospiraceae bacterium]|nr:D-alanyl-D-alanine carboxypeptidase family protein [Lachnospiraceae bacterium]